MSVQQLQAIAASDKAWASTRAQMALAIAEQYQGGGLNASEYQELMQDLVRMDKLDEEADDMALKAALVQAVYVVAQVA
jgi:hypothetical protein